ncbi:PPOX class F420-dependent oxidoreductase [Tsukamurella pseudospumae]|uniref:F420-dependent protein n=1 Tax=Tsukamurella pseudospumae TaxID=239498 RepID=A0A138AEJ3_9ACTN|nr:PPOX class F420-dependent oxidoreductase [Tsukamurella pseudospumae]KXP08775.1 F420-dependent protein [Tsukamurella pseudospumae]
MTVPIPDSARSLLERPLIVDLATVRPDGAPQVNPMWFLFEDGLIWFSHTDARQKYRNIRHEPRVAIAVADPADPQNYLEVRGRVERIEPDPTGAFHSRLSEHYGEGPHVPADAAHRVKIAVRPVRLSGRAAG